MLEARDQVPVPGAERAGGVALLRLATALWTSSDLAELAHKLVTGFGRLIHAPMYALYILDPLTGRPEHVAPVNVSETFLARYERLPQGRETDPLHARALENGGAAYNMALMSMEEWLESPLYTIVSILHDFRHVIEVPILCGEAVVGTINFATSDPDRGYTAGEVRLAEALGRLVGVAVEGIRAREDLEQELERARAALELTGSAVLVSDPEALELRLNEAARRLLAQLRGGEERVYGLIAPPPGSPAGFSRSTDVELLGRGRGRLHGYSSRLPREGGALVTVLEFDPEQPGKLAGPLVALTPREREVAALVVDGLADREIAQRLYLSRHTVSQYVKRVYRKLGVDSRVALTRLLLGGRESDQTSDRLIVIPKIGDRLKTPNPVYFDRQPRRPSLDQRARSGSGSPRRPAHADGEKPPGAGGHPPRPPSEGPRSRGERPIHRRTDEEELEALPPTSTTAPPLVRK